MMKNKNISFILISLISFAQFAWAEEVVVDSSFQKASREEYRIDSRYRAGEFLIYDCRFQHFACVNKDSFDRCKELRALDKDNNNETYSCAGISKFENKEACVLKEYALQDQSILKKFCYRQD